MKCENEYKKGVLSIYCVYMLTDESAYPQGSNPDLPYNKNDAKKKKEKGENEMGKKREVLFAVDNTKIYYCGL